MNITSKSVDRGVFGKSTEYAISNMSYRQLRIITDALDALRERGLEEMPTSQDDIDDIDDAYRMCVVMFLAMKRGASHD